VIFALDGDAILTACAAVVASVLTFSGTWWLATRSSRQRFRTRTARTFDQLDENVLPWFQAPKPGESTDVSLPGQVREFRGMLADHLTAEAEDIRHIHARISEQAEANARVEIKVDDLSKKVGALARRVDGVEKKPTARRTRSE